MDVFSEINKELSRVARFIDTKAREVIGTEAVQMFEENFEKQSFNDVAWKDVKRRDSSSAQCH